jgi:hypothetical protein
MTRRGVDGTGIQILPGLVRGTRWPVRSASLVVAAIASAVTSVAVIGYWIYTFFTFPWGS